MSTHDPVRRRLLKGVLAGGLTAPLAGLLALDSAPGKHYLGPGKPCLGTGKLGFGPSFGCGPLAGLLTLDSAP